MLPRLNLRLLALLAVLLAVAHASLVNPERREEIERRQDGGATSDTSVSSTDGTSSTSSQPTQSSSSSITSSTDTSTSLPTSSTSSTPTSSSSSSLPTSNTSQTSSTTPSNTPSPTPKPTETKDNTDETTIISSKPTLVVVKQTTTINGVAKETSYTSTSSVPVSTSTSQKGSESTGKGMSSATKRTVIGVVVGIIGAIVLGAGFFLAWRIWGRGKKDEDEDDTLSPFGRGTSAHGQEKTSDVGSMPSPFKTTLDQYHNPNAKTNVSSNF